jgi:DNA polymerase-1
MRPLLIVDGDNLTHRAYHSFPKSMATSGGAPINAIYGFFTMLVNLVKSEQPRGVFVAWDTLGVDTYRNELWPPYQGGRVFDPEIKQQLSLLPDLCRACAMGVGKEAGFEADDLVAAATIAETLAGGECLILTNDKDSFQLVSERVTVLTPKSGVSVLERIGPHQVVEKFGVLPEQVPDFKALCGDPSDKIPGAKGIGPKSAASLILRHGSLEAILEQWGRPDEVAQIRVFREVVGMRLDAVVELPEGPPDWLSGADALSAIGADGIAERLRRA